MSTAKLTRFSCNDTGNLAAQHLNIGVLKSLVFYGEFLAVKGNFFDINKPGYNHKLGKRARVLLPGQITSEFSVWFFDNFRKLFSFNHQG